MRKNKSTAVLPLGIKNRMQTELPALVALTAIGEPWFTESHQCDLLAVALVTRELAKPGSAQAECAAALQELCENTITSHEKVRIALSLAECLPWLQMQSNTRIERALRSVMARQAAEAPRPEVGVQREELALAAA